MARRWILVGLVASLAFNLFLIGAGAGIVALGVRMAHQRPRPALQRAALELPPAYRRTFLVSLRSRAQSVRPAVIQARGLRRAAWNSLSAANFNAAAAKAMLGRARLMDADSREKIEDYVIDFAAALPAEQRAELGVAVSRTLPPDRVRSAKTSFQQPRD